MARGKGTGMHPRLVQRSKDDRASSRGVHRVRLGHQPGRIHGLARTQGVLCMLLQQQSGPGWQSLKNVTFSPVGHAWLPKWLRPVTVQIIEKKN